MNRQKFTIKGCIKLSIASFLLLLVLFIFCKGVIPIASKVYENLMYYPEDLYKEYQEEAEKMIDSQEYTSKYPTMKKTYSENGQTTLIIEVGDYDNDFRYSDYLTATVKNFGTDEQEVTFERSRKSAEDAYNSAVQYKFFCAFFTLALIFWIVVLVILFDPVKLI